VLVGAAEAVGENIDFVPTHPVQTAACVEEIKTALRDFESAFTDQTRGQDGAKLVQIEHVRRGIIHLCLRQLIRRPVRTLLLFGKINAEQFAGEVFEAVAIRIGAHEARGDLGTEDSHRIDAEVALHDRHVKAGEMEQLGDVLIQHQGFEVRRVIFVALHLHNVGVAIASGELYEAELIPHEREPLGLCINGHGASEIDAVGKVMFMQMYRHPRRLSFCPLSNNQFWQCPIFGGQQPGGMVGGPMLMLSEPEIYQAFLLRTDVPGAIIGVRTTGVFCRTGCPARAPKFENCEFFDGAEAALRAGYRACKRCHPAGEDHALVRAVIALVEDSEDGRVDEAALRAAGIDPSTARRRFKDRLGMSVADYARLRRLGLAAKAMAGGASVIEAQLEAGFDSPSGFRAAYAKTFGQAPGTQKKAKGTVDPLFVDWLDMPVENGGGRMIVVADERALYLIEFVDRVKLPRQFERLRRIHGRAIVPGQTAVTQTIRREMEEYFAGTRRAFSVEIETAGTEFQSGVWDQLRTIPYGETWSYADLAVAIGNDKAVRAVASANGANGLAIVIPCHRVIASGGGLGGYAGGIDRKARLLALERAQLI